MQIELTELEVRFALLNIGSSVEQSGPLVTSEMEEALKESADLVPDTDNEEQIEKLFPGVVVSDLQQRAEFYERHTASAMRKLAAALKRQA